MKPFKSKPLAKQADPVPVPVPVNQLDNDSSVNPPSAAEVAESESESDRNQIELHKCSCNTFPGGYGHLVDSCVEDYKGYLWVIAASGRRMSQVRFCPFCGFQALNEPAELETVEGSAEDVLTTPPDRPQRVWKRFSTPYRMEHFRFGNVYVHASDGCHAKVKSDLHKQLLTVCVENLQPIVGIPCLPKIGEEKKEKKKKEKKQVNIDEIIDKYSFL